MHKYEVWPSVPITETGFLFGLGVQLRDKVELFEFGAVFHWTSSVNPVVPKLRAGTPKGVADADFA